MRVFRLKGACLALSLLTAVGFVAVTAAPVAFAQTVVTGGISGAVADATGAVVPGSTVTIVNVGTNATITLTTNDQGRYTASQLAPGTYKVSATATGLQSQTSQVTVLVGTTVPADIKLSPTANKTVIEVTSSTLPLVDTQNVTLATTFNEQQIQDLPTPGGDVTTVAFTAPGVVVNTGSGYGNFSSNGLPGISNLFVLNGFDNEDPFLNLNNSGSSNLTLGQGELAEATVIQNAYNSQYGRAAGAIISYTTKSGTNAFHGELDYNWNGTLLNANGWFNQLTESESSLPLTRPHAVSNEWAANVGGPIIKDKLFFFADYEGLRYVLPGNSGFLTLPSPQLDSYMLANVPAAAAPLYSKVVADFHKSSAYASAKPVANGNGLNQDGNGALGCGDLAGTAAPGGGTFGVDTPCMLVGSGNANNINKEWLFTFRADANLSDKQRVYGRFKVDHGSQPTYTSFVDPLFNALSIQPEYEGQFNDSYSISPTKTNVFVAAANWYSAYFGPQNLSAAQAELPVNFYFSDLGIDGSGVNGAPGLPLLGVPFYLTQGRNVAQYQIEDDFNWIHGKHTFKLGENFRRDLVSDYDQRIGVDFPFLFLFDLSSFANGDPSNSPFFGFNQYNQAFDPLRTAHLAMYNVGAYFEDDYQALDKLKLTLGLRIDRTGNPLCHQGCFSEYKGAFPGSGTGYNATVKSTNYNAFPKVEPFEFQPRVGFNYAVTQHTEVRGGVGLFTDLYPAVLLDGPVQNFPNYNNETIYQGAINTSGGGTTGAYAAAANSAVQSGFANGQGATQIATTLYAGGGSTSVPFSPPSLGAYFPGKWSMPEYLEYSLQVQHQIGPADAVTLTYAGNYGYNEIMQNPWVNAGNGYFRDGFWTGDSTVGGWAPVGPFGSKEFGATPPDPRFGKVNEYGNSGHSNYSGAMLTWTHRAHGLNTEVSYTYSHALDTVSNGGTGLPFTGASIGNQLTPTLGYGNLNYSNSDYDIRHNLVGDGTYEEPYKASNPFLNEIVGGWILGSKGYWRTGYPFSVTNGAVLGGYPNLSGNTLTASVASPFMTANLVNTSRNYAHGCAFGTTRCLNVKQYVPAGSQTEFGNLRRNQFSGPHYADVDVSLLKKIVNRERFAFELGANAYNVFNKVNFGTPVSDISSSAFGLIGNAVAPPTSPYGSFQGAAVTQRLLVLHGRVTF